MNITNVWQRCLLFTDTAKAYLDHPDEYVRTFDVTINGKLRHLITYMPNEKGRSLRILHTNFAQFLQTKYRHASSSYAYAKKKNIMDCVHRHLQGEVFLKTDIRSYFDSISYEGMIKRIGKLKIPKADMEAVNLITRACFYRDKLPLGFTSSPTLSDLFLVSLDRKYQKNTAITYTRYADDFIVSASGERAKTALTEFRVQLEKDLDQLDLELNRKKTYIRQLKQPGDAIHVLGVNIVRTETDQNRITISDRYIRETCKEICKWLTEPLSDDQRQSAFAEIYGKIAFIQKCSDSSFRKLKKMVKIKCGYEGSFSRIDLRKAGIAADC